MKIFVPHSGPLLPGWGKRIALLPALAEKWLERGIQWFFSLLEIQAENQPQLVQLLIRFLAGIVLVFVVRVEPHMIAEGK